jgi:hypothetical protein
MRGDSVCREYIDPLCVPCIYVRVCGEKSLVKTSLGSWSKARYRIPSARVEHDGTYSNPMLLTVYFSYAPAICDNHGKTDSVLGLI